MDARKKEECKKEYLQANGLHGLSSSEILRLLFLYGNVRDEEEAANSLLSTFGSLENIFEAGYAELRSIKGMSPSAAFLLKAVQALSRYDEVIAPQAITTVEEAVARMQFSTGNLREEEIYVLLLDSDGKEIKTFRHSYGVGDSAKVELHRLTKELLVSGARYFILAHNHPSGSLYPSEADVAMTQSLFDYFYAMGIYRLDHLLFAAQKWQSFKREGVMQEIAKGKPLPKIGVRYE
ncbi:MAG: RadC family protein [Clostridia bacterium]|nr:RadC family protein [Clostridia bacterium]